MLQNQANISALDSGLQRRLSTHQHRNLSISGIRTCFGSFVSVASGEEVCLCKVGVGSRKHMRAGVAGFQPNNKAHTVSPSAGDGPLSSAEETDSTSSFTVTA